CLTAPQPNLSVFPHTVSKPNFVSLNVKGINARLKRQRRDSSLKKFFLQETHLKRHIIPLKRNGLGYIFHSKFGTRSRGAEILLPKDAPLWAKEVISDPGSRYVILCGQLFNSPLIQMWVYSSPQTGTKFFAAISSYSTYNLIIGCKFNSVLNLRSSTREQSLSNSARSIL
uniref:Uncharacterized protein n=1 Tax=Echeneis naucrates TaxID=173247 RepID=A0A665WIA4_ECHNA